MKLSVTTRNPEITTFELALKLKFQLFVIEISEVFSVGIIRLYSEKKLV